MSDDETTETPPEESDDTSSPEETNPSAVQQTSAEQGSAEEAVEPEAEEEGGIGELPPTLAEAGLVGVRAQVAGQYTTSSGSSFWLSPGQGYAVSEEDAAELVEMGAVVSENS